GSTALNRVDIVGVGSAPSKGLRKGVVVNIESTVESIKKAVEEAETMAGIDIKAVHVGIAGGHVSSFQSNGVIAIKEKDIGRQEMDKVIDAARAVAIPLDREVLHVMPIGFVVDGQNGISDPSGMSGVRLEANVRIITGAVTSVQNLVKSCQRAGLDVLDIVLEPLASAEAALSRDEKDVGAGIVDIGGGTTDIALFHGGNICHTSVLTLGGNNFTNDVAIGLRVPAVEAEKIKKTGTCSLLSMTDQEEEVSISYPGGKPGRKIPKRHLVEILQPRAEELLYLVKEEIIQSGFHGLMTSGVVLTGGAALMKGIDIMAENIFELPVRIGSPAGVGGITGIVNNPMYATGVGLVLYGAKEVAAPQKFGNGNIFHGVKTRMKGWAKGVFR
ncbi:MAG TPA: cell division protein FtsA, partial [Nitrospirae bacterium]|nr:cell division protein FtsA [Nitrospirota bacterium]